MRGPLPLHRGNPSLVENPYVAAKRTHRGDNHPSTDLRLRTPRCGRILGALILLAASFLGLPTPATASDGFHQYSVASERSLGSTYRGVRLFREDMKPGGVPADGCTQPFTGHPVYQTMWVIVSGGWVEGGTGHQCESTYRYRFWGYGWDGKWHPQGTQNTSDAYVRRHHQLWRDGAGLWSYKVDSTVLGNQFVSWNIEGTVEAGLESYVTGAAIGSHAYDTLQYYRGGSWTSWAGFDAWSVDSQMCGRWWTASEWRAAQNRDC